MLDFNLREINWSDMTTTVNEQHKANLFVEAVRDSFLTQHVTEPTRIRENNEPTVLDLIFINEEETISEWQHLPSIGKSDHLVLAFNFNCYT